MAQDTSGNNNSPSPRLLPSTICVTKRSSDQIRLKYMGQHETALSLAVRCYGPRSGSFRIGTASTSMLASHADDSAQLRLRNQKIRCLRWLAQLGSVHGKQRDFRWSFYPSYFYLATHGLVSKIGCKQRLYSLSSQDGFAVKPRRCRDPVMCVGIAKSLITYMDC
jgi:hypothetical protein